MSKGEWLWRSLKQLGFGALFGALFGTGVSVVMFGQIEPKLIWRGVTSFTFAAAAIVIMLSFATRFGSKM